MWRRLATSSSTLASSQRCSLLLAWRLRYRRRKRRWYHPEAQGKGFGHYMECQVWQAGVQVDVKLTRKERGIRNGPDITIDYLESLEIKKLTRWMLMSMLNPFYNSRSRSRRRSSPAMGQKMTLCSLSLAGMTISLPTCLKSGKRWLKLLFKPNPLSSKQGPSQAAL